MHALTIRPIVVLLAFGILLSAGVMNAVAQDVTPSTEEATPTLRAGLPAELCTDAEIVKGDTEISETPLGATIVQPAATPGRDLYLVTIALPPGSCVGYASHYLHDGAIVWVVQSGEIEFAAQPVAGLPAAIVQSQRPDMVPSPVGSTPVALAAGDAVTADRATEYTYRNAGTEPAVVLMAVNELDPFGGFARSCKGGCRKR